MTRKSDSDRLDTLLDDVEAAILAADDAELLAAASAGKGRAILSAVLRAHRYEPDGRRAVAPRLRVDHGRRSSVARSTSSRADELRLANARFSSDPDPIELDNDPDRCDSDTE